MHVRIEPPIRVRMSQGAQSKRLNAIEPDLRSSSKAFRPLFVRSFATPTKDSNAPVAHSIPGKAREFRSLRRPENRTKRCCGRRFSIGFEAGRSRSAGPSMYLFFDGTKMRNVFPSLTMSKRLVATTGVGQSDDIGRPLSQQEATHIVVLLDHAAVSGPRCRDHSMLALIE